MGKLELNVKKNKLEVVDEKLKVDDVPSLENDDKLLVDLFRDEKIYKEWVDMRLENESEQLGEKATRIYQIILDLDGLVNEWAMNVIQSTVSDKQFDEERYIQYKTKFAEFRLEAVNLRREKVEWSEEETMMFILESGVLFDTLVNQIVVAFIQSVKTGAKEA